MEKVARVIQKKATEYVATFEPSLTVESLAFKSFSRDSIEKSITNLSNDQQIGFYQAVLEGLQQLQEKVLDQPLAHEPALDAIEFRMLQIQDLLKELTHQSVGDLSLKRGAHALPKVKQLSLEEKQQIALDYLTFLSGVNPTKKDEVIMSPREYKNLIAYTNYLIQHEQLPPGIELIKPTKISKDHIKFTYYLIHQDLYGTARIKDIFIRFLQHIFQEFVNQPTFSTLKRKFSAMPKSYYGDVKNAMSKIGEVT